MTVPALSLTVTIASYQRRGPLLRLLDGLADEVRSDPALADGMDVVVVLDGSDDGSREALHALDYPVPLHVLWQRNSGLAATRNAGWWHSTSDLVWFLDDDLVPCDGLVRRHREAHAPGNPRVVVGPCVIQDGAETTTGTREWWDGRYAEMAEKGITRFDQFSAANTSLPRALLEQVGGFDERFVGYGREDYEMGLRLLDAGTPVAFDEDAVAWHEQRRSEVEGLRLRREEGRNVVRFADLHPDRMTEVLGAARPPRGLLLLVPATRLLLFALRLVLRSSAAILAAAERCGRPSVGRRLMGDLAFLAGVLEQDQDGEVSARLLWKAVRGRGGRGVGAR